MSSSAPSRRASTRSARSIRLAPAWAALGDAAEAVEFGQRALTAAGRSGFRILEDRARDVLAVVGSAASPPVGP